MFRLIVLAMIVVPALEIWLLITVGQWIGGWQTFLLIVATGGIGAILAKAEARRVWGDARQQLNGGQLPGRALLDSICIFAGGLLLLTPGFITDAAGFLLVFPGTRAMFRGWLLRYLQKKLRDGSFRIHFR